MINLQIMIKNLRLSKITIESRRKSKTHQLYPNLTPPVRLKLKEKTPMLRNPRN